MSTDTTASSASAAPPSKPDLAAFTFLRPAEIKTYHRTTYDRLAPTTTFDGTNKTVLITAGGLHIC